MDYDETNRGVLFHESAPESDRHPNYTGKINVDGREYRLAGWKKTSKGGVPFLSLSVSEFQPKQSGYEKFQQSRPKKDVPLEDIGDAPIDLSSIPF